MYTKMCEVLDSNHTKYLNHVHICYNLDPNVDQ